MKKIKSKTKRVNTSPLKQAEYNKGRLKIRVNREYCPEYFPIAINLPDSDISIAEAKFIRDKLIKILG